MSSDSRWTGGLANREWQAGNKVEQPVDADYITKQVRIYLADCKRFGLTPTEVIALKIVYHANDAQKDAITAAFRQRTGAKLAVPGE